MLKPLETEFKGREISLECTHKKTFPPPQMYGHTPEDVDTLWKQGAIDQNQYQHLKVWKEQCGLMLMGPKCLDCPLALKRNPRPGRPNVIETESWLEAKNTMHWADMKAGKLAQAPEPQAAPSKPAVVQDPDGRVTEEQVLGHVERPSVPPPQAGMKPAPAPEPEVKAEAEPVPPPKAVPKKRKSKKEVAAKAKNLDAPPTEAETSTVPDKKPVSEDGLGEDILDALADD
jgi:hypothetical protein